MNSRRRFWLVERHAPSQYNPVRPIALRGGMTLTEPAPIAGPWPFTSAGMEAMCDFVSGKYGTTAAEFVALDADATLARLRHNNAASYL